MHSLSKPIRDKLYMDPQIADIRQLTYPLHSYIPTEQCHRRHYFFLDTKEIGPPKIDNFQYCGEVFPFCCLKHCQIHLFTYLVRAIINIYQLFITVLRFLLYIINYSTSKCAYTQLLI